MSSDFFGMPIGAAPVPFMVGELPGPVYRDAAGNVFQVYEQGGNRFARLME